MFEIMVLPYSSEWPKYFETEKALLEKFLTPWLDGEIEHIGSTAVPGLAGRPIIDILAPVKYLNFSRHVVDALSNLGYEIMPQRSERSHWYPKPSIFPRSHELHLASTSHSRWKRPIALREELLNSTKMANDYMNVKKPFIGMNVNSNCSYTDDKVRFFEAAMSKIEQ